MKAFGNRSHKLVQLQESFLLVSVQLRLSVCIRGIPAHLRKLIRCTIPGAAPGGGLATCGRGGRKAEAFQTVVRTKVGGGNRNVAFATTSTTPQAHMCMYPYTHAVVNEQLGGPAGWQRMLMHLPYAHIFRT